MRGACQGSRLWRREPSADTATATARQSEARWHPIWTADGWPAAVGWTGAARRRLLGGLRVLVEGGQGVSSHGFFSAAGPLPSAGATNRAAQGSSFAGWARLVSYSRVVRYPKFQRLSIHILRRASVSRRQAASCPCQVGLTSGMCILRRGYPLGAPKEDKSWVGAGRRRRMSLPRLNTCALRGGSAAAYWQSREAAGAAPPSKTMC